MLPIAAQKSDEGFHLPPDLEGYTSMVAECLRVAKIRRSTETVYLTVDERDVASGESHRRGGLHTESPGAVLQTGKRADVRPDSSYHGWGIGIRYGRETVGGIYMGSNAANSTAVYAAAMRRPGVDPKAHPLSIGELGDCEHYRGLVEHSRYTLPKNELVWMSDLTLHESLPLTETTNRQYFRLVVGEISAWYAAHSTSNPKWPLPGNVQVVRDSKFLPSAESQADVPMDAAPNTGAPKVC